MANARTMRPLSLKKASPIAEYGIITEQSIHRESLEMRLAVEGFPGRRCGPYDRDSILLDLEISGDIGKSISESSDFEDITRRMGNLRFVGIPKNEEQLRDREENGEEDKYSGDPRNSKDSPGTFEEKRKTPPSASEPEARLVERGPIRPQFFCASRERPYATNDWPSRSSESKETAIDAILDFDATAEQILRDKNYSEKLNPCLDRLERFANLSEAGTKIEWDCRCDVGVTGKRAGRPEGSNERIEEGSRDARTSFQGFAFSALPVDDIGEDSLLNALSQGGFQAARINPESTGDSLCSPVRLNWPDSPGNDGQNVVASRSNSRASSRAESPGTRGNLAYSPIGSPQIAPSTYRVPQGLSSSSSSNQSYCDTPSPIGYHLPIGRPFEDQLGREFDGFALCGEGYESSGTVVNSVVDVVEAVAGFDSSELQLVEEILRKDAEKTAEDKYALEEPQVVPNSSRFQFEDRYPCHDDGRPVGRAVDSGYFEQSTFACRRASDFPPASLRNGYEPVASKHLLRARPGSFPSKSGCNALALELANVACLGNSVEASVEVSVEAPVEATVERSNGLRLSYDGTFNRELELISSTTITTANTTTTTTSTSTSTPTSTSTSTSTSNSNPTPTLATTVAPIAVSVSSSSSPSPSSSPSSCSSFSSTSIPILTPISSTITWSGQRPPEQNSELIILPVSETSTNPLEDFQIPAMVASFESSRRRRNSERSAMPWTSLNLPSTRASERLKEGLAPKEVERAMSDLLKKPLEELARRDADGDTTLMCLVGNPDELLEKRAYLAPLVERLSNVPGALSIVNNRGEDALYLAATNCPRLSYVAGYLAAAMLQKGIDISQRFYNTRGDTLIHSLAARGDSHVEVLAELLALRTVQGNAVFDLSKCNYSGRTALHAAVEAHDLRGSAVSSAVATVRLLLKHGIDPRIKETNRGDTALHRAVSLGCDPSLVKAILARCPPDAVNAVNDDDDTALHLAAAAAPGAVAVERQKEVCWLLLRAGGNFDLRNRRGKTPLGLLAPDRREIIGRIFYQKT